MFLLLHWNELVFAEILEFRYFGMFSGKSAIVERRSPYAHAKSTFTRNFSMISVNKCQKIPSMSKIVLKPADFEFTGSLEQTFQFLN